MPFSEIAKWLFFKALQSYQNTKHVVKRGYILKVVIITGSREYKDLILMRRVFVELKKELGAFRLTHGDQRGADKLSEYIYTRPPIALPSTLIRRYPARWDLYGNSAGPIRNRDMIDSELVLTRADNILVVAFPLENSVGTLDCMKYARENNLEVRVIGYENR